MIHYAILVALSKNSLFFAEQKDVTSGNRCVLTSSVNLQPHLKIEVSDEQTLN